MVFYLNAASFCILNDAYPTINLKELATLKEVELITMIKNVAYLYQSREKSEYMCIEVGL